MKKQAEWGEAHRREALRRTYEIAAEFALTHPPTADLCAHEAIRFAFTETIWRGGLRDCGLDPARIDREVRRVRALAEGRLVRKTVERWRVYAHPGNKLLAETHDAAERPNKRSWVQHIKGCDPNGLGGCSVVRVRVTRIRRARAT